MSKGCPRFEKRTFSINIPYGSGWNGNVGGTGEIERLVFDPVVGFTGEWSDQALGCRRRTASSSIPRNDTALSTRGGAGLGLAIALQIVQAHGGQIEAQSTPGEGSTFILQIPQSSPAP